MLQELILGARYGLVAYDLALPLIMRRIIDHGFDLFFILYFIFFIFQLFLDDNLKNVAAGKALGLRTVLVSQKFIAAGFPFAARSINIKF